ncbi:MAG: tRNA 4-thiouridine(8) synthase ThiI [Actinomycetia bacterium]|nr:tRNA 4-thiouridine(8) synthase ThiI [Actinomycetes bacterium]
MVRAVALLSGGLDSVLAAKIIQNQGIEVIGIVFLSPFFGAEKAKKMASWLTISLYEEDISEELIEILKKPRHGFGKNMNPCIDCHSLMVKKADGLRKITGSSFIITGEVLGERPKSQNLNALKMVAKESGCKDFLIRPLSAGLLQITKVEEMGFVDRGKLFDISGRSRKRQMQLAEEFGLDEYPSPAGGCLLTEPNFSKRLKNLFELSKKPSIEDIELIKLGRIFFQKDAFITISRDEEESKKIAGALRSEDTLVRLSEIPGPFGVIRGKPTKENIEKTAQLVIRYSRARELEKADLIIKDIKSGKEEKITRKNQYLETQKDKGG